MNIISDQSPIVKLSELKPFTLEYSGFEYILKDRCCANFSLKIMPKPIILRSCPMTHPVFPWNTNHQRFLEIKPTVSPDRTIVFRFLDPIYRRILENRNKAERYIKREIPYLDFEKVRVIISPTEVQLFFICTHCGLIRNESKQIEIKHPENFLLDFSFIGELPCPNSSCLHSVKTEIYTPNHIERPAYADQDCDWYIA